MFNWFRKIFNLSEQDFPFMIKDAPLSGVAADENAAWNMSLYHRCLRVLSDAYSSAPCKVYKISGTGRERVPRDHYAQRLLDRPNPEMSDVRFQSQSIISAAAHGDFFAEIERNNAGVPINLWVIHPNRVLVYRQIDGTLTYKITNAQATFQVEAPQAVELPPENMLHVSNIGKVGWLRGQSILDIARESIGLTRACEMSEAAFFGNGMQSNIVFKHPHSLTPKAKRNIERSIDDNHKGVKNAHRVLFALEGSEITTLGTNPVDAELMAARKFQAVEWARWFSIPNHKLGEMSDAKWANVSQLEQDFFNGCMRFWFNAFAAEFNRKIILPSEQGKVYCEFMVDHFNLEETKLRYEIYQKARDIGFMNLDQFCQRENLPPLPDGQGQAYWIPANIQPIETALNPPAPVPPPQPPQGNANEGTANLPTN